MTYEITVSLRNGFNVRLVGSRRVLGQVVEALRRNRATGERVIFVTPDGDLAFDVADVAAVLGNRRDGPGGGEDQPWRPQVPGGHYGD